MLGALIGAGASILGGVLGSKSQNKAANKAADTSLQVANQNNALARDIYGQNKQLLNPYSQRGNAAGDQINAMLGLGGAPAAPVMTAQHQQSSMGYQGGGQGFPGSMLRAMQMGGEPAMIGPSGIGQEMGRMQFAPQQYGAPQPAPGMVQTTAQANPMDGFRQYMQNSDYGFQFGEGANALNTGYAARGALQSGAAMKALEGYRQNLQAGYRNEYMDRLGQQQNTGLAGASAVAGVGQNMVNNMTANNNSAGSAAANAALMRGASNANMWGGIGGAIGNAAGNIFGSSYGR